MRLIAATLRDRAADQAHPSSPQLYAIARRIELTVSSSAVFVDHALDRGAAATCPGGDAGWLV
jgi:hypothetical protein